MKDDGRTRDSLADGSPRLTDDADGDDDLDEGLRLSKRDFVIILVVCVILALLTFIAVTHGSGDTITPQ